MWAAGNSLGWNLIGGNLPGGFDHGEIFLVPSNIYHNTFLQQNLALKMESQMKDTNSSIYNIIVIRNGNIVFPFLMTMIISKLFSNVIEKICFKNLLQWRILNHKVLNHKNQTIKCRFLAFLSLATINFGNFLQSKLSLTDMLHSRYLVLVESFS